MVKVQNLSKVFPDKKLFDNVNLAFIEGNTYGVIGANGVGKSTFLKILSQEIEATSGEIIIEENKRISTLEQDQNKHNDQMVTDLVVMGNHELYQIQQEKNAIYENPDSNEKDYEKAAELEEKFGQMGGWNAENDAQILLSGLGIAKAKWQVPLKDLKAQEKIKVLLAKALFGEPDILIMDEPTNHLDLKAIKWLENFLLNYKKLVIIVSHDVDFLDQVCTHIVDIDYSEVRITPGNYSFWKQSSQLLLELKNKQNAKKEEQIKQLESFIARFSANASKSSQATSRKKSLEKIKLEEIKPSSRQYPYIRWDLNRAPGKDVLKVENLSYVNKDNQTLFANLSFSINRNEKVALIGADDLTKRKILEILLGIEKPTTGTVKWGLTIKNDYFPSDNFSFFQNDKNILEWISDFPLENEEPVNKDNSDSRMRSFLGRMLFRGESVFKKAKDTSGGEKARLMFSRMMLKESNFLLFDQPLNHLDSESIDSFIEGLKEYNSSCIFVTYNRQLIKKVANVILEVNKEDSYIFRGSLEEYEKTRGF